MKLGSHPAGLQFGRVTPELNGVGAMPSAELERRLVEARAVQANQVEGVYMDTRLKESSFGCIKFLLQAGRLVLPRHPALLKQLSALEFQFTDGGSMHIAVPEPAGHDDLAMGLCLAFVPLLNEARRPAPALVRTYVHDPTGGSARF